MLQDSAASEELGGLLQQHLSELDDRLATLTRSYNDECDANVETAVSVSDTQTAQARSLGLEPQILEPLAVPPPPRMKLHYEDYKDGADPLIEPVNNAGAPSHDMEMRSAHDPEMLEAILKGIETKKLSAGEALSSLERACYKALQPISLSESQEETATPETWQRRSAHCRQCGILGLQVRALAQSLSGLAARVVQWSAGLSHRRQADLVDLVLSYLRPLEHLDERLEALCTELTHDVQPSTAPAPSSKLAAACVSVSNESSRNEASSLVLLLEIDAGGSLQ